MFSIFIPLFILTIFIGAHGALKITPKGLRNVYTSVVALGLIYGTPQLNEAVTIDTSETSDKEVMTFGDFVPYLREGKVNKVVFEGVRPTFLTAYRKDGSTILVEEGFPSFDDPLGPSGPTQAIALAQHTPVVVVEQDLSDLFRKSKTARYGGPKPMLESNYPAR